MVNKKTRILGVIPARYKSTRFEGKPLTLINGVPMIKRTYNQAKKSELLDELIVATDDTRILTYCESEGIPVIITSENCLTGTDRLAEVSKKMDFDLYVNIQGDEPVIDPNAISQIVDIYHQYGNEYMVYNLYKIIDTMNEVNSHTIIKVIVNEQDEVMYMSRFPVPFSNSGLVQQFRQQIPVYGFTKDALSIFSNHKKTINEQYEDIELLRFLDLGYKIKMSETKVDSIAVDVPNDVKKVEMFLNEKGRL
ncbi:MAG: 3-deoxy-manno-octulosonate cytidylyltransferase [Arcobacteraceae bacterium]|nr:3-deoxy-manno-octulosonate cytidylyltransferase [Arcobacteraceae bacterium]MDD3603037.1 3-deoxy-manno-octulosonate cytidylyltransferase [Sulfurovum sp.]